MALGIRLNWAQFGDFDSFEVLRSDSPMNTASLPSPLVMGIKTMTYFDTNVIKGSKYYYRIVAIKGGSRALSSEIICLASELDEYRDNVTALLFFNDKLYEEKSKTNFTWGEGSKPVPFVASKFGKSLDFDGTVGKFVVDTRNQSTANNITGGAFTIEFYAKLNPNSTGTRVAVSFGSSNSSLSCWVALNLSAIGFYQSVSGSGASTSASFAIPTEINTKSEFIHYAVSKNAAGNVKLYANGILLGQKDLALDFSSSSAGWRIGRLDYSGYSYDFIGQIGPFRVTKGISRYNNSSFTPPEIFLGISDG